MLGGMSLERVEPFWTHVSAYKLKKSLEMGNFVTNTSLKDSGICHQNFVASDSQIGRPSLTNRPERTAQHKNIDAWLPVP